MPLLHCLLTPKTPRHKRTCSWRINNASVCKARALEHATVLSRTVAHPCQGHTTALGVGVMSPEVASASGTRHAAGPLQNLSPSPLRAPPSTSVHAAHGAPRPRPYKLLPTSYLASHRSPSPPRTSQTTSLSLPCSLSLSMAAMVAACLRMAPANKSLPSSPLTTR